jgi:hypothetical protein
VKIHETGEGSFIRPGIIQGIFGIELGVGTPGKIAALHIPVAIGPEFRSSYQLTRAAGISIADKGGAGEGHGSAAGLSPTLGIGCIIPVPGQILP